MSPRALLAESRTWTLVAALLLVGPAFSGCLAGDGDGSGTAAFYVKDAPSDDFEQINVTFSKVSVHAGDEGEDGDDDDGNETDEADGNETADEDGDGGAPDASGEGWVTVFEGERTVDLLAYNASDARALLGADELEAGTYNQVVITVESAYGIHADDGSRENFTVTTGWIKLTRAWTIEENMTTHVTADIDVDRSIVKMGPQGYRLNPVVGQVIVETNDEGPGSSPGGEADDEAAQEPDGQPDQAQASMYVKDAPTDEFDEIWVGFDEVEVHLAGDDEGADDEADDNDTVEADGNETEPEGNETADEDETEGDDGRWITAVNESREVDLLRFSDPDARAFLGDAELPEGKYTQIRVHVTEAWGVRDNETENITVASETAKINKPWHLEANDTVAQVTIDLDLDQSLVEQGNGEWRMTPVIGSVVMDWVEEDAGEDQPNDGEASDEDGPQESQDASGGEPEGNATAYVKDAPTDEFREIWVTFDEVRVHKAGNETEDGTDGNASDGEWLTLFDGSRSVNLLNFSANDSKAFLGDAQLDVGRYTQIRVNVTDAWGILNETGERENITVTNTTTKVVRTFTVDANDTTQVVIDVDLDESLHKTGQGYDTSWRLTPKIGHVAVDHVEEDPRADQPDGAEA